MDQNGYETIENVDVVTEESPRRGTPGKGLGIAGMACGIVSLAFCCCYGMGLSPAIVGLVLSTKSKKRGYEGGFATAGYITSLIGVILNPIIAIIEIVAIIGWIDAFAYLFFY